MQSKGEGGKDGSNTKADIADAFDDIVNDRYIAAMLKAYKQRGHIEDVIRVVRNEFFWPVPTVVKLLQRRGYYERNDRYLDYGAWRSSYPEHATSFVLKGPTGEHEITLPYEAIVDVSAQRAPRFPRIDVTEKFGSFELPATLGDEREEAFKSFCTGKDGKKKNVTNGPILGIQQLDRLGSGDYEATLRRAGYFDQIRTNLTLDFLPTVSGQTLRGREAEGLPRNERLRRFETSLLVNSIGVSTIVIQRVDGATTMFVHCRKDLSVYGGQLGTVSGVVNYFDGQPCRDLGTHVGWSVIREFERETGLNAEKVGLRVTPLAFCRELLRGGKPQFFFLIEITEPVDRDGFSAAFQKSAEGLEEFVTGLAAGKIAACPSSEYACNLVYALKHLAARSGHSYEGQNVIQWS